MQAIPQKIFSFYLDAEGIDRSFPPEACTLPSGVDRCLISKLCPEYRARKLCNLQARYDGIVSPRETRHVKVQPSTCTVCLPQRHVLTLTTLLWTINCNI